MLNYTEAGPIPAESCFGPLARRSADRLAAEPEASEGGGIAR